MRRRSMMTANAGHLLRVVFGVALGVVFALPTWWSLRADRTVLRETKALIEADLALLAAGAALGNENNKQRALLLSRKLVVEEIDRDRMAPIQWLGVLGTLPADIVLTRAVLGGEEWAIEGATASTTAVDALPDHFERAGFVSDGIEKSDAAQPVVMFKLRGRNAEVAE